MPICLDPNFTFELVLDSDAGKENATAFVYKALSCREWMAKAERCDQLTVGGGEELAKLAAFGLVAWKNIDLPFDADRLADILTPFEAYELIQKHLVAGRINAEAKKN